MNVETYFKFYNVTEDDWHEFVSLGDRQWRSEFTYRDSSLLSKISDIMNHVHSFVLVPFQNHEPDFSKSLEIGEYSPDDIELIINYMRNLSN